MAIGISFDSTSFKEFNRALKEFETISVRVDSKMLNLANRIDTTLKAFDNFNIKGLTNVKDAFLDYVTFLSSLNPNIGKNFTEALNKITNAFQTFSKSSVFKFNTNLSNLDNFVNTFYGILAKLDSLKTFSIQNLQDFAFGLKTVIKSFTDINSAKIDLSNITYNINSLQYVMKQFAGTNLGFFGNALNSFKNFFGKGSFSFIDQINKLGSVNIDGFRKFALGMSDVVNSLNTMGTIKIDTARLTEVMGFIQVFIKSFTGATGFLGGIRNTVATLFGKDGGIISQIATVKLDNLNSFAGFANAVKQMTDALAMIGKINVNVETIKNFASMIGSLVKALNQEISGGNFFQRMIGNFTSLFGIFNKSPYDRIIKLADALEKLSNVSKNMSGIQEAMKLGDVIQNSSKAGEDSGKGFIASFKKVMGIASPSKVMQQLGEFAAEGFRKGFNILSSAFSSVKGFLGNAVEGVKSLAGKIGGFFKNLIPFNPFNKLNEDANQSGNFITRIFNGLKDSIVINISGLIQNVLSSAFDTLAGSAIQFESGFAGVLKAMDTSDLNAQQESEYIKQLDKDMRGLAVNSDSVLSGLENASSQILTIAENAGSLGIARENVNAFTETVGAMAIATNLSADAASTFFGTFGAVTGTTEYERLGSTMVELGNKFSATESQIADFSLRLAGAGESAGFSEAEILGVSAAMASVGLNAEAGGSAMTQIFDVFTKAVAKGGSELDTFTEIMGVSSEEFKKSWSKDPAEALTQFVDQFGKLDSATQIGALETLGLDGIRTADVLRRLGNAEGTLANALDIANEGWQKNSALMEEAEKRNLTTQSSINRMKNVFFNLQVVIGRFFMPIFKAGIDLISDAARSLTNIIETNYDVISGFFSNIGSAVAPFFNAILDIGKTLTEVFGNLFSSLFDKFRGLAPTFGGPLGIIKNVIASISKAIQEVNFFLRDVFGLTSQVANALGMKVDNSLNTAGKIDNEMAINDLYDERLQIVGQINELQTGGAKDFQDYVVKAGDTLSDIAAQNGVSLNDLLEANNLNISDAKGLQVDTKLKIPVKLDTEAAQGKIDELQSRLEEIDKPKAGGSAGGGVSSNYKDMYDSIELVKGSVHSLTWKELPDMQVGFEQIASGNILDGFHTLATSIEDIVKGIGNIGSDLLDNLFSSDISPDQSVLMNATQGIFSGEGLGSSQTQNSSQFQGAVYAIKETIRGIFAMVFWDFDMTPEANLLLWALTVAISLVFGPTAAVGWSVATSIAQALNADLFGLKSELEKQGVFKNLEDGIGSIKHFIDDLLSNFNINLFGTGLVQTNNSNGVGVFDNIMPDMGSASGGIEQANNTISQVQTLFDTLKNVGNDITNTLSNIDISGVLKFISDVATIIYTIGDTALFIAVNFVNTVIIPGVTSIINGIKLIYDSFSTQIQNMPQGDADKAFSLVDTVISFTDKLKSVTSDINTTGITIFTAAIDSLSLAISSLNLTTIQQVVSVIIDTIGQFGNTVFIIAMYAIENIVAPALRNFGEQISLFVNSLDANEVNGFVKTFALFLAVINGPAIIAFVGAIAGPIALLSGLANSIGTFGAAFAELFGAVELAAKGDIDGTMNKLVNFISGIWNGFKDFTVGAVQPFIDIINKLLELTGTDLRLISVEQAFADLEKYIKGVGIIIALFLEDLKSRIELQFLDIQLRVKQAQIDIQLAVPEAARDNTYLADLQKQKAELEKFQQDRSFSFDFQSQLAGQFQAGTLDLNKSLTVTDFDGNPIQKSLLNLINDPSFVSQMSGSTKQLLINSADQAFKSSDPVIKANAAQVYASLHMVIPKALLPKQNEELIATGLQQYQDLIASGFTNVKIAPPDYQSFFEDISYAASNEMKLIVPTDKINQFGIEVMSTIRDSFKSGASNEDMASIWNFVAGDVSRAKLAGVDMATGLLDGAVEAFNNQDQTTLMSSFLPTIDPESAISIQEQFDQQLAIIASKYGPDKAAQIGQAVEIGLENLTLTATGESVDLVVDPAKIQTDLETNQQAGINTFIDFGSNLIAGLTQGLSGENDLTNTVETVFNTANDAFKAAAGIESPSTVFAEHGLNMIEGLAQGINDNVGIAQTAFAPLMVVVDLFGLQMNAIFDNYLTKMALVGITTIAVALQITNGFLVMSLQSILLGISLDGLLMKINSVLTGLAGIAVGAQVAINTGTGASVPVPAAAMPSTASTENREFGGGIQASKVYEVLENQLPFEMFAGSNGKKYFIANQNGTMYSPRGSALPAGYGATNNNSSNVTNGGDTYDIQINGTSANPKEIADAVMNKISSNKSKEGKRIHKTLRRNGAST